MRPRDDRGTATPMIVGLAVVLMMTIAVVIDASAAYLQRQGLDSVADGAALYGSDAAGAGIDVYATGLGDELSIDEAAARAGVEDYLRSTGAYARYPGLSHTVHVDQASRRVVVEVRAPLDLPLTFPGSPEDTSVSATGNATVTVDR